MHMDSESDELSASCAARDEADSATEFTASDLDVDHAGQLDISKFKTEKPTQPILNPFPSKKYGKLSRSFNSDWYRLFPWLEYSAQADAAFCYPCRMFSTGANEKSAFVNDKHIQTRWKSFGDKFRRLCVALKAARTSGAGAKDTGEADVAWPYFESMLFLKDSMEGRPNFGRATKGQAAAHTARTAKGANIIACMSGNGVIHWTAVGRVHWAVFNDFINDVSARVERDEPKTEAVFIFDGARAQTRAEQAALANSLHSIKRLPAYSPFFNPIEEVFSKFKSHVKAYLSERRDLVVATP
ncbi:hypothetical protein MTO96_001303 [Rhipicephalus appendiculatus]